MSLELQKAKDAFENAKEEYKQFVERNSIPKTKEELDYQSPYQAPGSLFEAVATEKELNEIDTEKLVITTVNVLEFNKLRKNILTAQKILVDEIRKEIK